MIDMDKRVGKLEQNYAELKSGQDHLQTEMKGLKTSLDKWTDKMEIAITNLSSKFTDSQKAPWPTLLAALSTVIIIVGLIAGVVYRDVSRIEAQLENVPTRQELILMERAIKAEINMMEVTLNASDG